MMETSFLKGGLRSMTNTELMIYTILGPTRHNTLPLSYAIDLAIELLFTKNIAMDDICVTKDLYRPVAQQLGKSVSATSRQIVRLSNLCWDAIRDSGEVERYIGKPIRDLHAPNEMIFYFAFLLHFGRPFFQVVQRQPELLF